MISPFAGPMSVAEAHELAAALKAVADPARLRIVSLLAAAKSATVGELTARTWLQQPTVSHHLKILARAGLVEREEQRGADGGTWSVTTNRLDRDAFADPGLAAAPGPVGALT